MTIRLYLDTSIANDAFLISQAYYGEPFRHRDYKQPIGGWILEYIALYYLLDLDDQWDLEFGTSAVMHHEISRMKEQTSHTEMKKTWLLDMYDMLTEKAEVVEETATQLSLPLYDPDGLKRKVGAILPDEEDVNHVCQAILGNWDRFITTDRKTVLAHTAKLKSVGITAASPLTFLESEFMPLPTLIRTLHGAQASPFEEAKRWLQQIRGLAEG